MSRIAAETDRQQLLLRLPPGLPWAAETPPRTVGGLLRWRAQRTPFGLAYHLGTDAPDSTLSWAQTAALVDEVAAGLLLLGLPAGAVVALASTARVEAAVVEWAVARAAAVNVGLHPEATSPQVRDLLALVRADVLVAEDADQLTKVREHWPHLPHLRAVVVLDDEAVGPGSVHAGDQRVLGLQALRRRGRAALEVDPALVADVSARVRPGDVASLVDAADPDGPPQLTGVSHDEWTRAAAAVVATGQARERDVHLFCVPTSHPLGRTWRTAQLLAGFPSAVVDDLPGLGAALLAVRPHVVVALAPTLQRGHAQARLRLTCDERPPTRLARWALGDADDDRSTSQGLTARLVLPRLRSALGGRLHSVVCAAPVDPAVRTWFARLGVQVLPSAAGAPQAPSILSGDGLARRDGDQEPDHLPALAVEARFAASCPYAGHLVRFGEPGGRVALVTLDADAMATWSQHHGMAGERYHQVVACDQVRAMVQRYVDRLNARLPVPERIRRFAVLPEELTVADGTLTWGLEVRRAVLARRHAAALAGLHGG